MNKSEAVQKFVSEDLSPIPQDWVKIVADKKDAEVYAYPMWGTMWFCNFPGAERLYENARKMVYLSDDIDLAGIEDEEQREKVRKAIETDDWDILNEYIDQEMSDTRCVIGKDGNTTSFFIYEIEGEYLIGINAAGFNFYDSVWPSLYDALGLQWHSDEESKEVDCTCAGCGNEHKTAA